MNQDLMQTILRFRDERNWKQYHNPKDLAISICLEASELLEHFQWSSWEEALKRKKEPIADELADIFIYCMMMADACEEDVDHIIRRKLEKNEKNYPVDKAYGKKDKYTDLQG